MIHFQIDSFLGEVCRLKRSPQTGFYKRMKKVLDEIDINDGIKEGHQKTSTLSLTYLQRIEDFPGQFHYVAQGVDYQWFPEIWKMIIVSLIYCFVTFTAGLTIFAKRDLNG